MIGALERNECCAFNPSSEFLPLRELYARVGTSVQHQGRRSYILQQMPHIDFSSVEADPDVTKMTNLITVNTIVNYVERKLNSTPAAV